jgi:predicted nuclease of predicted toxin-antitoxin system
LLGAGGAPDDVVWRLAKEHGCVLVTRDEDFLRLSIVRGAPPKVVWLAVGTCSNQEVIRLLRTRHQNIHEFCGHDQATFLTLGA